jgi:hypothetical protein
MARTDGIESVLKHVARKLLDSRWERVAPLLLAIRVIDFPLWISSGYEPCFVVGYRTFIFKHQVDTPPLQLDPMKCSSAFSRQKVFLALDQILFAVFVFRLDESRCFLCRLYFGFVCLGTDATMGMGNV